MMRPTVGFAPRLAALYAAMFAMLGIQLPFFPVWLKAKGLDAQMIGVVLAIPMIVRVFAIPVAARVADRRDALRAAIVIASCASVAGYAMTGFAAGAAAIVVTYGLASLAFTPVMPLTETYALRGLGARGKAYGPVRLWGSVAFIAGSFLAGYATDVMPARELIWLIVAALLLTALAAHSLEPLPPTPVQPAQAATARKSLLRDPAFVAVLAAASLIQASHAVYYGFSALAMARRRSRRHRDRRAVGARRRCRDRAVRDLRPLAAVVHAGRADADRRRRRDACAGRRWRSIRRPLLLPWLQLLHALSFGATFFGSLNFVARRAPPGQSATAQGYLAIGLGRGDGGRDGTVGIALCRLRRRRLCGDGANGARRRRLRFRSVSAWASGAALSAHDAGCRSLPRCR